MASPRNFDWQLVGMGIAIALLVAMVLVALLWPFA